MFTIRRLKKQQFDDDPETDKAKIKIKEKVIENLKDDLKTKEKEKEQLQKYYEKSLKKTQKISQLEASISPEEQTRDLLERRFNSTRSFDALKEQESNLLRQNEEDQAIINDDDTEEIDKEAAEKRVCRLRSQKEKTPCLSKKGSKKFSKNTALL